MVTGLSPTAKATVAPDRKSATLFAFILFPPARDGPDAWTLVVELCEQQRALHKIPAIILPVSTALEDQLAIEAACLNRHHSRCRRILPIARQQPSVSAEHSLVGVPDCRVGAYQSRAEAIAAPSTIARSFLKEMSGSSLP